MQFFHQRKRTVFNDILARNQLYIPQNLVEHRTKPLVSLGYMAAERVGKVGGQAVGYQPFNIIGALVFVVLLFWIAYLKDDHKQENQD